MNKEYNYVVLQVCKYILICVYVMFFYQLNEKS